MSLVNDSGRVAIDASRVRPGTAEIRIPEVATFLQLATRMTRALVLGLAAVLAAGCSDSGSSDSSLLPTTPGSATQVVDTFSGTVPVGGSDTHTFIVTANNQPALITLTSAGPPATISMGLGVGTLATDGTCSLLPNAAVVVQAGTAAQLSGTIATGTYCVAVFDVGNQSAPVDYTVTVSHY